MGGKQTGVHPRTAERVVAALVKHKGARKTAAADLGMSTRRLQALITLLQNAGVEVPKSPKSMEAYYRPAEYEVEKPASAAESIDELLARRKQAFTRKDKAEKDGKLIPVRVKIDGPVGIIHFGDPHVDDDGTDIGLLEQHVALVKRTPALFAANVGDTTNNWVGRLAHLYGQQGTTAEEAWMLAEWLFTAIPWLYAIAGNHDAWSGAGDPLKWIAKQRDTLYQSSEARLAMNFPNGRSVRINARHDFAGSSQYNPAHGPMKAAIFGVRDHVNIAGHRHESGYGVLKDPTSGITMHAIRVASYKRWDRYAKEKGFRDNALSPCAMTLIDPSLPDDHPDLVKVYWDPEHGADYLTWLRKRKAA